MTALPQNGAMELDPKYDHYDFPTVSPEAKPGHAGHLSDAQKAQVSQLRMMLEGEGCKERLDTLTLLRFLRARKFDVDQAKKMFIESDQWRKSMTVWDPDVSKYLQLDPRWAAKNETLPPADPINLDETVPVWDLDGSFKKKLSEQYQQYYHKTDKDGRPVYIEQLGGIDLTKIESNEYQITKHKMLLNLAVEYEKMADPRLPACSRKAGQLLETCCTVMDFTGVSIGSIRSVVQYVRMASAISNANYPERLGRMYLINTPRFFNAAFAVIRAFLDPVTADKIKTPKNNAELLMYISAENLPKKYGGTCQCEGGCELSDAGPWREEEWYRPAWWEKKREEAMIENKPTEVAAGGGAPAAPAPVAVEDEATAPATAAN